MCVDTATYIAEELDLHSFLPRMGNIFFCIPLVKLPPPAIFN